MTPIHLGIAAACGLATAGLIAAVMFNQNPEAQRLLMQNDFEDAACVMEFYNGAKQDFSVRKSRHFTATFNKPKEGFVLIRCTTVSGVVDSPAGFHLRNGEKATLTLKPDGKFDLIYRPNTGG
jgi:hypothetical protein